MGRFIAAPAAPAPQFKSYVQQRQQVRLGRTQSGQHGLFTGGFLAWPLSPEEHAALSAMPYHELRSYVQRRGFDLYPASTD